jgi:hypothetical protein
MMYIVPVPSIFSTLNPQYIAQQSVCAKLRVGRGYCRFGYNDVKQHLNLWHDTTDGPWWDSTIGTDFLLHTWLRPSNDGSQRLGRITRLACRLRLQSKVLPALRRFPWSQRCENRESKADDVSGCGCGPCGRCTVVVAVLWCCRVVPGTRRCNAQFGVVRVVGLIVNESRDL